MKKLALGIIAAIGLSTAAQAADMAVKARVAPPVPVFSWTGFYVGAHGGGMWADKDWTERCSALIPAACVTPENPAAPFRTGHEVTSGIAGIQAGYNWQTTNNFVLGIEGDLSGAWGNESCSQIVGNQGGFFAIQRGAGCSSVDWLATVTGRAGIAMGMALFYVKGGVAFAHDDYVVRCTALNALAVCPNGTTMTAGVSDDRVGWTVGVGLEYAFAPNWSVKGEYNYMDFGTERNRFTTIRFAGLPADSNHDVDISQRVSVVKFGVNYRFNWGKSPVVAKY